MLKIIKIFLIVLVSTNVIAEASGTVKIKDIEKIKMPRKVNMVYECIIE